MLTKLTAVEGRERTVAAVVVMAEPRAVTGVDMVD